jgi:tetratricopeptide (TPR) repeat protein
MVRTIMLGAALLSAPSAALADTASDVQAHMAKAAAAHKEGNFELARSELQAAYALDPKPALLYALGQVSVKLGNCTDAISYYEQYLATHPAQSSAESTNEAVSVCKLALEQAKRQTVTPDRGSTKIVPTQGPVPPVRSKPPFPPPRHDAPTPWFKRPVGLALLGGGTVCVGAGVVFYLSARSTLSDAEHAPSYPRSKQLVSDAHDKRNLSLLVGGIGVALLGGGAAYYLTRPGGDEHPRVSVIPTLDGVVVSWGGSLR